MKGFVLSKEQLSKLKAAHRKAKRADAHAAYKINAVILLGTHWALKQVKQALLLDEETLRSYVKKYREKGIGGEWHFLKQISPYNQCVANGLRTVWLLDYRNIDQHNEKITSLMGGGFDICYP